MTYNVFSGTLNPTDFTSLQHQSIARFNPRRHASNRRWKKTLPHLTQHRRRARDSATVVLM